jgi:hypothetical protein
MSFTPFSLLKVSPVSPPSERTESPLDSSRRTRFVSAMSFLALFRPSCGLRALLVYPAQRRMDLEDRAYIVYVATQRWLALRLDAIGALLILAVALLVVRLLSPPCLFSFRTASHVSLLSFSPFFQAIGPSGISPSQVGLLLTYTVSLVQMFGMLTRSVWIPSRSHMLYYNIPTRATLHFFPPLVEWPKSRFVSHLSPFLSSFPSQLTASFHPSLLHPEQSQWRRTNRPIHQR